jgi:hypothetical protein
LKQTQLPGKKRDPASQVSVSAILPRPEGLRFVDAGGKEEKQSPSLQNPTCYPDPSVREFCPTPPQSMAKSVAVVLLMVPTKFYNEEEGAREQSIRERKNKNKKL